MYTKFQLHNTHDKTFLVAGAKTVVFTELIEFRGGGGGRVSSRV